MKRYKLSMPSGATVTVAADTPRQALSAVFPDWNREKQDMTAEVWRVTHWSGATTEVIIEETFE